MSFLGKRHCVLTYSSQNIGIGMLLNFLNFGNPFISWINRLHWLLAQAVKGIPVNCKKKHSVNKSVHVGKNQITNYLIFIVKFRF